MSIAVSGFIEAAEQLRSDRKNPELRRRVAEAAGRANGASEMAGLRMAHRNPPAVGGRSIEFDPIKAWDGAIDPFTDNLSLAIDFAHQVRSSLESKAEAAEQEEHSLVGWVARFIGFPARVRAYLRDRGYPPSFQLAGLVASVSLQLAVGVAASLIVAWLTGRLFP